MLIAVDTYASFIIASLFSSSSIVWVYHSLKVISEFVTLNLPIKIELLHLSALSIYSLIYWQ